MSFRIFSDGVKAKTIGIKTKAKAAVHKAKDKVINWDQGQRTNLISFSMT